MNTFNQIIQEQLNEIKKEMLFRGMWQSLPPAPEAFLSEQPFAIDTMSANEWLQWIFLPRIQALIDANCVLPRNFSLSPYFEEALQEQEEARQLLSLIKHLDQLVTE